MAQKIRTIRLLYENDGTFTLDSRLDSGELQTIITMTENNFLPSVWSAVDQICKDYFTLKMNDVADAMINQ